MSNTLHDVLTHCIAEATNEFGSTLLDPTEIYADMARRLLAVVLEDASGAFSPADQIITVRVADLEAWILEAYGEADEQPGESYAGVSWRMTPVGWKPSIQVGRRSVTPHPMCRDAMCPLAAAPHLLSSTCPSQRT